MTEKASVLVEKLSWPSLLVKVAVHWLGGLGPNCSKQPCTCSCCCDHNSDLKSAQFQHNLLHLLVWNISFWKDGFCHVLCYLDTIGWLMKPLLPKSQYLSSRGWAIALYAEMSFDTHTWFSYLDFFRIFTSDLCIGDKWTWILLV